MRIATWNVNSITARLPRLLAWLESSGTDVLCLQEVKTAEEQFPAEELREPGTRRGPRHRPVERSRGALPRRPRGRRQGLPGGPEYDGAEEPRAVSATCGPVRVWSVYVPNGREVGHAHYAYKLQWFEALKAAVADDAAGSRPFAVLGDYNVAPTDEDVWDGPPSRASPTSPRPSAPPSPPCATPASRTWSPPPQVRPPVHVLGLPPARLPQEPRHAHRPRLRQRPVREGRHRRLRRPRGAKGEGRLGPRSGRGRPGRLSSLRRPARPSGGASESSVKSTDEANAASPASPGCR